MKLPHANAAQSVRELLEFLGEDPDRNGLKETPARVVRALLELTRGYKEDPAEILSTTFEHTHDAVVVLRGIRFQSLCEHHLLPFTGTAVVGYLPGERVVGLSKLARLVQCHARRLQIQEKLTADICLDLMEHLNARGAAVVITSHHACMGHRGANQPDAEMVTSAMRGLLLTDEALRSEFLRLAGL